LRKRGKESFIRKGPGSKEKGKSTKKGPNGMVKGKEA